MFFNFLFIFLFFAEHLFGVFEGFFRASNSGEVRGAGLGLGIVQHFARAHGGEIVALPRDGGGTIMRLTLPLTARGRAAGDDTAPEPR